MTEFEELLNDYKSEKKACVVESNRPEGISPYMKYREKQCDLAIAMYDEAKRNNELDAWYEAFNYLNYVIY